MKIITTFPCYNELIYLSIYKKWCDSEDIEMAMLDNYSNDGSYEWGLKNCEHIARVNTNNTFDLAKILVAKEEMNKKLNPDWILRGGVDTFIFTEIPLKQIISENSEYDIFEFDLLEMYNTGEKSLTIFGYYYYKLMKHKAGFVHKNINLKYIPDDYDKPYNRFYVKNACVLNYGGTKPAAEREETYRRRKRAWKRGLHPGWGVHYIDGHKRGWKWDKSECQDLRQSRYWYFLKDKLELLK